MSSSPPLSPDARAALRARCTRHVLGHREADPGADLIAIGEWCRAQGAASDRYGDGALLNGFEAKVATLLGKDAGVFMPSGTMAQQAALRVHADDTGIDRFAMHPTSHLELHEMRAYAELAQLHGVLLGDRERPTVAHDLAAVTDPLAALLVELPAREIGGQLPSWEALVELASQARARGVRMHMDGARLWEAREAYAPRTHAQICALFDSVYVSFYKGIGALAGAMLLGDAPFIAKARTWRKRYGGTLVQLHPFVASAAMRFDAQLARMASFRDHARALAEALTSIPGAAVLPDPPQVNMFHLYLQADPDALTHARDRLAESDGVWLAGRFAPAPLPRSSMVEVYVGENLAAQAPADVRALFVRVLAMATGDAP